MAKPKIYECRGYNFNDRNFHLLGEVGKHYTLDHWIEVVFRNQTEKAREFFKNDSDADILQYLKDYYGIRLEKM